MDPESVDVTAGLEGFLAFFLLAVALYLLMRNMNARMRRMAYRAEQEAKAAQEKADEPPASDEPPESDGSDSSGPEAGPDLG
jgi:flagellar biosynthesis/type III secretory pathway M-ring protein FliF/YscJ